MAIAAATVSSSNAVQIFLLVGGLSLVPAMLFCITGFSRILIVLGFIRTAMGTSNTPPNQMLVGIALFGSRRRRDQKHERGEEESSEAARRESAAPVERVERWRCHVLLPADTMHSLLLTADD